MAKIWKPITLLLTPILVLGLQFGTLEVSYAATNTDLRLDANRGFANQAIELDICNEGSTAVKQNLGSYNMQTMTWTGLLDAGECVNLVLIGNETGNLGDTVSSSVTIISSVHNVDDTLNVDSNSANENGVLDPYTIVPLSDLKTEARLITTGVISPTDNVQYEITLSNIGTGTYYAAKTQYVFVLPEDSAFMGVTDNDAADRIDASTANCESPGRLGMEIPFPGLDFFDGRLVMVCELGIVDDEIPANSDRFAFTVTLQAGNELAAGTAEVLGMIFGNDPGTSGFYRAVKDGNQLLDELEIEPNNNFVFLTYDPTALAATASLCPGQPATSTDGTACFRISFNKDIVEDTFGTDDFTVTGSGTVSSLEKIGPNLWEIRIVGIAQGQAATITLLTNDILDLSAVGSSVSVLGINTIRFDAAGTVAGTLPATGANTNLALNAFALLLAGFALMLSSRKKKIVSRARYSL